VRVFHLARIHRQSVKGWGAGLPERETAPRHRSGRWGDERAGARDVRRHAGASLGPGPAL